MRGNEASNVPSVGININVDRENWVYYILSGQKTIETRPESCASQWRKHIGETIGLVRTHSGGGRIPTGLLVGTAQLVAVKTYGSKADFDRDLQKHFYKIAGSWEKNKRCGLVLENAKKVTPRRLKPMGLGTVREIEFV